VVKNAWNPGRQAEAATATAFFITHLSQEFKTLQRSISREVGHIESVLDGLVNWAMKKALVPASPFG